MFSIPFFIFHPSFQNNQQGASRTDVPLLVFKFLNADTRTVLYWAYLLKQTRKRELIMWLMFAVGSALFAGLTSILAKCGIRKTDSTVATAIRTIVVLIFSWAMVFLVGSQNQLGSIGGKTLLFLVLSGLATGGELAVLLPGPAGRPGQPGGPHRQAEHSGHCPILLCGLPRKALPPLRPGAAPAGGRNAGDAAVTDGRTRRSAPTACHVSFCRGRPLCRPAVSKRAAEQTACFFLKVPVKSP